MREFSHFNQILLNLFDVSNIFCYSILVYFVDMRSQGGLLLEDLMKIE